MTTWRLVVLAAAATCAVPALAQQRAAPAPASTPATPAVAGATDRADLERTQITGNRELPKVLYIVPWKKPVPGAMSGRPVASVLDEALAPVDRDVFRRQVQYDAQLNPTSSKSGGGGGAGRGAPPPPHAARRQTKDRGHGQ
jgi:hypothetical protein